MGLTYTDLATQLGVKLCQGAWYGEVGTPEPDHIRGWADRRLVHWWPERRVTKPGLRRFLTLVAATRLHGYQDMNAPMRLYATNAWAVRTARDLHVRIPHRYADEERRRARWLVSKGEPVTPAAKRWAYRISQEG